MEAHCSTGDPLWNSKRSQLLLLAQPLPCCFQKKPHRVFSLRIYFLLLKYSTFTPERQYNPRKFLFFSIFTDCVFLFLRNYLFRMRLFAAGPGGWVGALWEGWQVCGARFPSFAARWVHRAPANGLRCLRRRVCVWWIACPPTGRRSPFTTGCGFAADMPFAFLSPLPRP